MIGLHDLKRKRDSESLMGVALAAPALLVFLVFFVYPNLEVAYLSLFNWAGISKLKTFVGLDNYAELIFKDEVFRKAIVNTAVIALQSIVIQIPAALAISVALNRRLALGRLFMTIFFLPTVISLVATGMIWSLMYDPSFGSVNLLLGALGLERLQPAWLGDPSTALPAVIITINWVYVGLYAVILSSALKTIPQSVFDSAKVDGLSEFATTVRITAPMLREVIAVLVVMSVSGSFKSFDLIWSMTGGGPVNSTEIATTHLYKMAFRYMRSGYASAIGVCIFLICLAITAVQLKAMKVRAAGRREG